MRILALLFTFVSLAGANKPNIIVILGDDLSSTGAGFRVAGIMSWPEKIKAANTVSHVISALDFLPTPKSSPSSPKNSPSTAGNLSIIPKCGENPNSSSSP